MVDQLPDSRLARLLAYLDADPDNRALLIDAAGAAFDARDLKLATNLSLRAECLGPSDELTGLTGLIALAGAEWHKAEQIFDGLCAAGHDTPANRFNRAWALAMLERLEEALELLDSEVLGSVAAAPDLRINVLHRLQRYDQALAEGADLARCFPANQALMSALATLAMDADKPDLARSYAERAPDTAGGTAALGMLALEAADTGLAHRSFDAALKRQPTNPRGWIGKGLAHLTDGETAAAAAALDRGANLFGDHLGSWIAAGWAHYLAGDLITARQRFESALVIDDNFAETHGALAVLDIAEGRIADGKRHLQIALRLDRRSFGGALANSLILDARGNYDAAERIRGMALDMPIGLGGQTLAAAIRALAARGPRSA